MLLVERPAWGSQPIALPYNMLVEGRGMVGFPNHVSTGMTNNAVRRGIEEPANGLVSSRL